jgi:hypothetical protein
MKKYCTLVLLEYYGVGPPACSPSKTIDESRRHRHRHPLYLPARNILRIDI